MSTKSMRQTLRTLFLTAVASADPQNIIAQHLPPKPKGRCLVVGAGKASAAMAAGLEAAWPDSEMSGLVVTRYGHGVPTQKIKIVEAAHPVPDLSGLHAAEAMMALLKNLSSDDLVIALISGGGSALLPLPAVGLSLSDKQEINKALLKSGATIGEMNIVRKHLSRIKGGKLADAAFPAQMITLVISDVPGDDPALIASGPTVYDDSTPADAKAILKRYAISMTPAVAALLDAPIMARNKLSSDVRMIASPLQMLQATAEKARSLGFNPLILGDALEGEAREVGIVMAGIAKSVARHNLPVAKPALLLSGGECTVSIGEGRAGRGGRNTEFLLSFSLATQGEAGIFALAADSDGIDGTEDAAGAVVDSQTLERGELQGLNARQFLRNHDSYSFFKATNDLIITGPTLTNVNDIRMVLIV